MLLVAALVGCVRGGFAGALDGPDVGERPVARDLAVELGGRPDGSLPAGPLPAGHGAFILYGHRARRLVSFDRGDTWPVDQQDAVATPSSDRWIMGAASSANGVVVLTGGPWGEPGGFVLRSTNGTDWAEVPVAGGQGPLVLAFGGASFVAINNVGERYTSPDGQSWSHLGWSEASSRSICFGQNRFFAVGDNGRLSTSTDGVDWQSVELGGEDFVAAVCGADRFVAMGNDRRLTTLDGLTPLKDEVVPGLVACGELAYGGGVFIDNLCNTSADGLDWLPAAGTCRMCSIAYGEGVFMGVSTLTNQVLRSEDGRSWQTVRERPHDPETYLVRYVELPAGD